MLFVEHHRSPVNIGVRKLCDFFLFHFQCFDFVNTKHVVNCQCQWGQHHRSRKHRDYDWNHLTHKQVDWTSAHNWQSQVKGQLISEMSSKTFLKIENKGALRKIVLSNPAKRNSLNLQAYQELTGTNQRNSSITASVISTFNLFMRRCIASGGHRQLGGGGSDHRRRTILQFGQRFKCISNSRRSIQKAARVETDYARSDSCLLHIPEAVDLRRKWTLHRYRGYYSSIVRCDLCIRHGKSTSNQMTQKFDLNGSIFRHISTLHSRRWAYAPKVVPRIHSHGFSAEAKPARC